ncbi:MAG: TonB-dependent receptor [Pseudomonadota bacterium]
MLRPLSLARASSVCALAAALASAPQAAFAQLSEASGEEDATGPVIIVTAQKREEAITDVPATVSALSGENLQAIGIDEFDEVAAYIPGLIVQEQSPNNPGFVIRGITSDSGSAQIAPRVTIYYNGVDVSRSRGSYFDLFDIERIEVVKGPQATLFGTASTIGAISVVTATPKPGFEAQGSVSYGNLDAFEFDGMINVGNDVIAARLAGTYKRRDGYVENIAGRPGTASEGVVGIDQADLNGVDQFGLRGSLRFTPTPDLTIDLVATYEEQNNPGTAFVSGTIPATGGDTSPFTASELGGSPFSESVLGLDELGLERSVFDISGTIEYSFGDNWTLTSITGYREFDSLEVFDADGSALFFLEFAEEALGDQFSHETRISYDSDMFRGFFGVNYFQEDGTQGVPFSTDEGTYLACIDAGTAAIVGGVVGVPANEVCSGPNALIAAPQASAILTQGAASVVPYESVFINGGDNSSFSVFADGTLVLDRVELTAGLRYITEDRRSTFFSEQPLSALAGFPLLFVPGTNGETLEAEDDFDAWLPRFNVLFRATDDVNLYATVSKGRRSPVIDLDQDGATLIDAEEVWNYEGGVKANTGQFAGSVGVFFQDYTNFQTSFIDGSGQIVPVNAGEASNFGIEAEAVWTPTRSIRVFANYAYIDAEIDAPSDQPGADAFVGSRFRLQPEHSASGGIDAAFPIGNTSHQFFLTPSVTYQSRVFFEQPNDPDNPTLSEDGYTLVNLRAGVRFKDGQFGLTFFARNLLDEEYLIDAGNTGAVFGTPTFIAGEPRLYGIELSARY